MEQLLADSSLRVLLTVDAHTRATVKRAPDASEARRAMEALGGQVWAAQTR